MSSRNDQHLQPQTSSHKRGKKSSFSNVDSDALESVITFLPIKEATKLSILSKRFRHSWKICRNLCFDRSVIERMSNVEFKTLLNNFFQQYQLHKADKFSLRFDPTNEAQQVYEWIEKAAALGVTELELNLRRSDNNNIRFPINHLLVGRVVEKMKLVACEIHFPLNPNGVSGYFPHLRELTLESISITQALLGSMLVSSPSLTCLQMINCSFSAFQITIPAHGLKSFQKLAVSKCWDLESITIDAPSLCSLHYHGKMIEFVFRSHVLPRLNDVVFDIDRSRGFGFLPRRNDVMIAVTCVRVLSLSSAFLEGLSSRYEVNGEVGWGSSNIWLWRLKEFNLDVTTESFITPKDIVEFLKKCKHIENLNIVLGNNTFKSSVHWNVHGRRYMNENTLNLPRLKTIMVTGFAYNELAVTMVRFFLKNAQHLRDLIIVKAKNHNFPEEFSLNSLGQGLSSSSSSAINIRVMEHRKNTKKMMNDGYII